MQQHESLDVSHTARPDIGLKKGRERYFKGVTAVCFPIDHIGDFVENPFASMISSSPIIPCSTTVFTQIYILRVI
jgi:hypothetical protein